MSTTIADLRQQVSQTNDFNSRERGVLEHIVEFLATATLTEFNPALLDVVLTGNLIQVEYDGTPVGTGITLDALISADAGNLIAQGTDDLLDARVPE